MGFIDSPDPQRLRIYGKGGAGDPIELGIKKNAAIGLLGIEFYSRRRNRMNGLIRAANTDVVEVDVEQSFGNCPKYIHLKQIESLHVNPGPPEVLPDSDKRLRTLIESTETFFVSSYADMNDKRQVDVSHRGGEAGFVKVDGNGVLTVPDFTGNNFFSTLGNIYLNNRAGLTFVNWKKNIMLQMTGFAEVYIAKTIESSKEEKQRFWKFRPEKILLQRLLMSGGNGQQLDSLD